MYSKDFIKLRHQKRVKLEDLYERKLWLYAAFPQESKRKNQTHYYILYLSQETIVEKDHMGGVVKHQYFVCFCGGKTVVEKLDTIKDLVLPKATPIEMSYDSIDGGEKFLDIFFFEIDQLSEMLASTYEDITK